MSRSFPWAIALVLVAACAREVSPAASAAAPAPLPSLPSLPETDADAPTNNEREGSAPALARGDTISLGSVRMGNQRPLKAVVVPFATYLDAIHLPIHREFSDKRLAQLDALPPGDPRNHPKLVARLELVLDGASGALVKVAVVKSSGVTGFDALAVDAVTQAGPFAEAPAEIRSTDGNVYVHWEFGRDPTFGCSTVHARPFLLTVGSRAVTSP